MKKNTRVDRQRRIKHERGEEQPAKRKKQEAGKSEKRSGMRDESMAKGKKVRENERER